MTEREYSESLNPQKALIWRIVHLDNIAWVLEHGLHCGNSSTVSPNWTHIGNTELIDKRANHPVPVGQGGYLNDYVPFYFTPFSPMLLNITTGRGGVQQRPKDEIVILVSSLHRLQELNLPFVFTDGHAYYQWSNFYTNLADLNKIDWQILQKKDFSRDVDDPAKFERYQAEALVHQHCPIEGLLGMICYNEKIKSLLEQQLQQANIEMPVYVRSGVYFK